MVRKPWFSDPTMNSFQIIHFGCFPLADNAESELSMNLICFKTVFCFFCATAHPGLCLTEPCITVASAVLGAMDRSVDPCQDFYNFACGGWIKNNPLYEGKSRWGSFSNLWEHNMLVMKQLLGKDPLFECSSVFLVVFFFTPIFLACFFHWCDFIVFGQKTQQ